MSTHMPTKPSMLISTNNSFVSSQQFVLFVKVREITEVNTALNSALKLPMHEQKQWAEENGRILDVALETFIDDTNVILDKISFDDEVLNLSEKLVVGLKNAVQSIDQLLGPQEELES